MEFDQIDKDNWEAILTYRELWFYGYGSTKQKAGDECFVKMQEYIDDMQKFLNDQIR